MSARKLQRNPTTRHRQRNRATRKCTRSNGGTNRCCCGPTCPEIECVLCSSGKVPGTITATVVDLQVPNGKIFYPGHAITPAFVGGMNIGTNVPPTYAQVCFPDTSGGAGHLNATLCLTCGNGVYPPQADPPHQGQQSDAPFYCGPWMTGSEKPDAHNGWHVAGDIPLSVSTNCQTLVGCGGTYDLSDVQVFVEVDFSASSGWIVTIWGTFIAYLAAFYVDGSNNVVWDPTCAHGGDAFANFGTVPFILFQGQIGDPSCNPSGTTITNNLALAGVGNPVTGMDPLWSNNNMEGWMQLGFGGSVVLNACCAGEYYL